MYELDVEVWPTCIVVPAGDARDRPPTVFGGAVSVHCGPRRPSPVLLPIIPPKRG